MEEHLLICPRCQDKLAAIDEFVSALRYAARDIGEMERGERGSSGVWGEWGDRLRTFFSVPPLVATAGVAALALCFTFHWQRARAPERAAAVWLQAVRGGDATAVAPAGRPVRLHLDLAGVPELAGYRVEVVDDAGQPRFEAGVHRGAERFVTVEPKLAAGKYWVRLYEPPQTLLREFGLEVR